MSQKITIKTVVAPAFNDCNSMLTPRLSLQVSYTKGGTSCFTGKSHPRGYDISVVHDRISEKGYTSILLDCHGNPAAMLEPATRFSAKTLQRIADDVRGGKHDALIATLYAKARANRSEHAFPVSILPLVEPELIPSDGFADGGCEYSEDELQSAS